MPAAHRFVRPTNEPTAPALSLVAITPDTANDLAAVIRDIRVGSVSAGGTVNVITTDGVTITFSNCYEGEHLGPFFVARVLATSTATGLVGYV